jgi:hypothetical protein
MFNSHRNKWLIPDLSGQILPGTSTFKCGYCFPSLMPSPWIWYLPTVEPNAPNTLSTYLSRGCPTALPSFSVCLLEPRTPRPWAAPPSPLSLIPSNKFLWLPAQLSFSLYLTFPRLQWLILLSFFSLSSLLSFRQGLSLYYWLSWTM